MAFEILQNLWGDNKIKYEVYIRSFTLVYTCVSTKPRHEVLETLKERFCNEKTDALVYTVDKETHKRDLIFTIKKTGEPKKGNRNSNLIYDTDTQTTYKNSKEAQRGTGVSFIKIIRECRRKSNKTRFIYIKEEKNDE